MQIEILHGAQIEPHWQDIAQLRIAVFREFPYLYQGTLDYERDYLKAYWESPDSVVIVARDGERAVGASTALPMTHEHAEIRQPVDHPENYFYLGESILLPEYRGRGLGHVFFDEREKRARQLGRFTHTCFCAVVRPPEHPLRPPDYRELHGFWQSRGYQRHPCWVCQFDWQDIDQPHSSSKSLAFWTRPLA